MPSAVARVNCVLVFDQELELESVGNEELGNGPEDKEIGELNRRLLVRLKQHQEEHVGSSAYAVTTTTY